ncbi:MAG: N-acetyl-gamma-glutamyl-phosphate reductase, partial [Planctomycetota bacterium]
MIRAGIVGATGLVGESLARALLGHPEAELTVATSAHAAGSRLDFELPALRGEIGLKLVEPEPSKLIGSVDVAFLAGKGPDSMKTAPELLEGGVRVIDIGGE